MKTRLLGVDAPEWESFLGGSRHDFYHLPRYVALCATQEQGEPGALYVTDVHRTLLLPLIIRGIPGSDSFDATSPYGYPGPVEDGPSDPAFVGRAMVAGMRMLREAGIVSAFVRLHPLLNAVPPRGIGILVAHGETVSIDLTMTEEALWSQTRLNHRRDIRKALQIGCVARMDEAWDHYETFRRLYRTTMHRRAAADYYLFADSYFDGLREALKEGLHLCVVEKDGAIAAAGLFVETNGIVQYHLSGTDEAFAHVQSMKLMMHFVRGWAKRRGNHRLHLGGGVGGASDSLFRFKEGFSPLRHRYHTLRVVLDEPGYRRLVAAHDPHLDADARGDYFPLYRRG